MSNRTPIDKPLLECNLNGDQVKVSPTMRNEKHIMKFVDRFSHLEMMVVEECGVNIVEARECLK